MSVSLLHRSNSTSGAVPSNTALKVREIGINTADGILYVQQTNGNIKPINPILGPTPNVIILDMGSIPVSTATFFVNIPGLGATFNLHCAMSGVFQNTAFADELEMEPMNVHAHVVSAGLAYFVLTCTESVMQTVGKKTVTFYAG